MGRTGDTDIDSTGRGTRRAGIWLKVVLATLALPASAQADTFAVMSYNVRGLPPELIEDRAAEIAAIAPLLEDFHTPAGPYAGIPSIVGLQELFSQAYYNVITSNETITYPFFTSKNGGGPNFLGDGLNKLSDFPFGFFMRTQWEDCFGTLGDNGSDCDTNKGFTFARFYLDGEFVTVDIYTLHADAGQDAGSRAARRANIDQLVEAINTVSSDSDAVIVLGDTNSLYTRVGNDNIQNLLSGAGLTDVWVELRRGGVVPGVGSPIESDCVTSPGTGNCELVDKIFYRSGETLALEPLSYSVLNEMFSDDQGDLSDHFPVAVTFDYEIVTTTTTTTTTTSSSTTTTSTTTTTTTTLVGSKPCGDPIALIAKLSATGPGGTGESRAVAAGDALFVLKSAVQTPGFECALCTCDVNNSSTITTADALQVLRKAVGQNVTLTCPAC